MLPNWQGPARSAWRLWQTKMATVRQLKLQAFVLSSLLLLAALLLIAYSRTLNLPNKQQLLVRQVDIGSVPLPPPPPPPAPAPTSAAEPLLQLQLADASVSLATPPQITQPETRFNLAAPVLQTQQLNWQALDIDISALSLDQLDALPQLQTPLNASFPRSLTRKGVTAALVKLDVLIDEQGRLTLLDIVQNPYPELANEIERLVRSSRFSPPTQHGQAVSARFIWPVEFKP